MTRSTETVTLASLGDALSESTQRDLGRGRSVRRVVLAVAAIVVIGTGTAAAATLLSPKQVAAGMPAGAVIFDQTAPSCVAGSDRVVFHCVLGSAPSADSGIAEYTGTKEVLVVAGVVAGGCIGQDAAGMTWDCYVGHDAVVMDIITQDFLGEPAGPGAG